MRFLKTLILPFALVVPGLTVDMVPAQKVETAPVVVHEVPTQAHITAEKQLLVAERHGEIVSQVARSRARERLLAHQRAVAKQKALARAREHARLHRLAAAKRRAEALARAAAERRRHAAVQQRVVTHSAPGGIAACIRKHESGGNYRAVNPSSGAGGAYQFMPDTWHRLGYSGLPQYAAPATQDAAFYRLWNGGAGASQWTTAHLCGY